MFRRILKLTARIVIGFIGFVFIYALAAFCLSRITVNADVKEKEDVSIYILTNGVHTDLVLPIRNNIKDWSNTVKFENTTKKDSTANFVAFGWGDKGFYLETPTWADLKFSTAFAAAFALDDAAMHTTFYKRMTVSESCKMIKISNEDYKKLVDYISASFKKSEQGNVMHIITNANYGKNDAFYEAVGSYSLFHTCNTWANNGLKACGQKAGLWTASDTGIFCHYQTK